MGVSLATVSGSHSGLDFNVNHGLPCLNLKHRYNGCGGCSNLGRLFTGFSGYQIIAHTAIVQMTKAIRVVTWEHEFESPCCIQETVMSFCNPVNGMGSHVYHTQGC